MKYVIILIEYDKNFKRFVKKYEKFLIIKTNCFQKPDKKLERVLSS